MHAVIMTQSAADMTNLGLAIVKEGLWMATWHQHLFQSCIVKRGFVVDMKYNNGSHIILLKDP